MATGKRYYWLKLKRDFFKRHDIRIIEKMPNGRDYVLFYLKMLVESIDHGGKLRFNETIPYDEQMLSVITSTNIDLVRSAMKVFINLGMIEVLDDETIYMTEVKKMTGSEGASAARVRAHREAKRLSAGEDSEEIPTPRPKTNAERQRIYRAKKAGEQQQHVPRIETHTNNERYGGNYYVVMQRDGFKCAECNAIEGLCVHHIDGYDKTKPQNNEAHRMVVLCRPCHGLAHTAGIGVSQEILNRIGYSSNDVTTECNAVTEICNTEKEKELDKEKELEKELDKESTGAGAPPPPTKRKQAPKHKYGEYGWVLLTNEQYQRLLTDLGESELGRCIQYVDESAQSSGNKNRWKDWNLVIRRCSREGWGRYGQPVQPAKVDTLGMLNKMLDEKQ